MILIDGKYKVYDYLKQESLNLSPLEFSSLLAENGAGELMIRCINNDGRKKGYIVDTISSIAENVKVPVIAAGGYGNPIHALECLRGSNISACAIGNSLNFTEHSISIIKSYLTKHNLPIRHDSSFSYNSNDFTSNGRLAKSEDDYLENLFL